MKILLVDDSTTMRKILINILAAGGMSNVLEASNSHQAVETVMKNDDIGLVLMGWNIPGMQEIEALERFYPGRALW